MPKRVVKRGGPILIKAEGMEAMEAQPPPPVAGLPTCVDARGGVGVGRGKVGPPDVVTKTTGQTAEPNGKGKATLGTFPIVPKRGTPQVPDMVTFKPGDLATVNSRGPGHAEHKGQHVIICTFVPTKGTYIVQLPGGGGLEVQPNGLTLVCRREDI